MLWDGVGSRGGAADGTLLVVGGAGGVPSVAIQLARLLTGGDGVAAGERRMGA